MLGMRGQGGDFLRKPTEKLKISDFQFFGRTVRTPRDPESRQEVLEKPPRSDWAGVSGFLGKSNILY